MKRRKQALCALAALMLALFMTLTGQAVETVVVHPEDWLELDEKLTLSCHDMNELFQLWESTSYPDYVCGVWSTDGGGKYLTVGIVEGEDGEAGKKQILSLIEQDETVTFVTQKHSRNSLLRLARQYSTQANFDRGMRGYGLYEQENVLEILVLQSLQDDPQTQGMIESIQEEAGDAVRFHYIEKNFEIYAQSGSAAGNDYLYLDLVIPENDVSIVARGSEGAMGWLLLALVLTAGIVWLALRKRIPLLALAGGGTAAGGQLGQREVERMLQEEAPEPSAELEQRILAEIERK